VEPRDPTAPGFGAALESDPGANNPAHLVLHPRAAAWLWIIPCFLCGLFLSACNASIVFGHPLDLDRTLFFAAAGLLGLVLLVGPPLTFFNSEMRFSDGVVVKRGALRRVQRWEATDFRGIRSHVRNMGADWEFLEYNVYHFLLKAAGSAFALSEAWWKKSEIEALARALGLYAPDPSGT
jgi:hypothetical protein